MIQKNINLDKNYDINIAYNEFLKMVKENSENLYYDTFNAKQNNILYEYINDKIRYASYLIATDGRIGNPNIIITNNKYYYYIDNMMYNIHYKILIDNNINYILIGRINKDISQPSITIFTNGDKMAVSTTSDNSSYDQFKVIRFYDSIIERKKKINKLLNI